MNARFGVFSRRAYYYYYYIVYTETADKGVVFKVVRTCTYMHAIIYYYILMCAL